MKICTKCKETKELSGFYKKKDGLTGRCKVCIKANMKGYYTINKDQIKAGKEIYRQTNREKRVSDMKVWYRDNKEQAKAGVRAWREANPHMNAYYSAKYRAAKLQRTPSWLTTEDWNKISAFYTEAQRLSKETGISHHVDHVIPLQGETISGFHHPDNLQILTKSDNCAKGNTFLVYLGDSNE